MPKPRARSAARWCEADLALVYGGGKVGLMGVIADTVMAEGGRAIGVIPELLVNKEVGHNGLTELHVVPDMHHRKKMMADLSDAFVAMPGGVGTLEELFEVYTWAQLGYHQKPVALLNIDSFYDPLINLLQHTVDEGFMRAGVFRHPSGRRRPCRADRQAATLSAARSDKWAIKRDAV